MKALKAVLAVLVLAGAAAGISYATSAITRTATSTLQACANNTNGNLRLVASPSDCRTNESAVSWNVVGPTGPTGPQGPQGEQGPVGPQGPAGQDGKDGVNGKDGANGKDGTNGIDGKNGVDGKDGANGVSPVVTQLAAGDPNCLTGGASITDGLGHVAYVCNGAKGDTGASGTPFSGLFQSPSGDFKLSVSDAGIKLQGPVSKITLDSGSLSAESSTSLTVKAGANLALDGSAVTSVNGAVVNIGNSGGCTSPLRVSDVTGAFVGVGAPGIYDVVFPGLSPIPDVCVG